MKSPYVAAVSRLYPHLVQRGPRLLRFTSIAVSNQPFDGPRRLGRYSFIGVGMLDARGDLTPRGRELVHARIKEEAALSPSDMCVVWGPEDCTWYDRDGRAMQGRVPPRATDTMNPYVYDQLPLDQEDCWTIRLPEGSSPPFLCVMRLGSRHIEIAPGEPSVLGNFDGPVHEGEASPAEPYLGTDGALIAPATFRGQRVTGIEDGWLLAGPVQPQEDGVVLRQPWPHQIREACRTIVGFDVDESVVQRIFRIAHPDERGMNWIGVLEAA